MKIGILTFSYANFPHFKQGLARAGHYTVNLGDNAQSIAARALYRRLEIDDQDVLEVDRDTLASYRGNPVRLLMNAVFRPTCFPIPEGIQPIFLGFTAGMEVLVENIEYLRKHQPIGCRDRVTAERLVGLGVDAFVSGCVTMTLARRKPPMEATRAFVVYGTGTGRLPEGLLRFLPPALLDTAEFFFHRLPVFEHPLGADIQHAAEAYEVSLMRLLSAKASVVITPLHHVAAPCMAMGIPTVICRADRDPRFSFLEQIAPIHTQETFATVDWAPNPVDVHPIAEAYSNLVRAAIRIDLGKHPPSNAAG